MTVYVSDKLVATPATVTGDPTPTTEWQWLRNNQPISGATTSTYDVDYNDLNTELTVVQKAVNMMGASYATSSGTGTVSDFTPSLMYRGGANGVWYDPSDITRYMSSLGPELVTNGDFSTDTAWTKGTGVTIVDGKATFTSVAAGQSLSQVNVVPAGKTYQITFTVSGYSSGSFVVYCGAGSTGGPAINANGTYTQRLPSSGTPTIYFYANVSNTSLSIDNISVRELNAISTATLFQDAAGTTPVTAVGQPVGLMLDKSKGLVLGPELVTNGDFTSATGWTAAASWGIASGVATKTAGTDGWVEQPSKLTVGAWYQFTLVLTAHSGGNLSIGSRAGLGFVAVTASGARTVTGYFNATATGFGIYGTSTTSATVDNISVRELPGNHAFNPSGNSANFPVLSARYNLLTKTEDFSDSNVWTGPSVSINQKVAPDGTLTADKVAFAAGSQLFYRSGTNSTISAPNSTITGAIYVWSDVNTSVTFRVFAWGGSNFDSTETIIANQWNLLRKSVLIDGSTGNIGIAIISPDANTLYIWGADLRVANDALNQPTYQRVNTATDYDTVGFKPYLSFNGVNQWLQTNSIDFTYGDKMFVSAGVRKLSDGARGHLLETGPDVTSGYPGSFALFAPEGASSTFTPYFRGDVGRAYEVLAPFVAPITNVISIEMFNRLPANGVAINARVNGTLQTGSEVNNITDEGTFGNYPLYIGARAGSSLWFNGRLYGLVVVGKQARTVEISSTERYLNQKTGAY